MKCHGLQEAQLFLQIITASRRTIIPVDILQRSSGTSSARRKPPTEAKTTRNSLSWTILQITPLF